MAELPIYQERNHFAPVFEISLGSGKVGSQVLRAIQQVSYSESDKDMDSFEFVLNDWDSNGNTVIYSSPYDASGKLRQINGKDITPFDPGTQLTLKMGYLDHENEPLTMMTGEVVSVEPSFPASGLPTVTIRAISGLNRYLNKVFTETFDDKKPSQLFKVLAQEQMGFDGTLEAPLEGSETEVETFQMTKQSPVAFLLDIADELDYRLQLSTDEEGKETLYFGPQKENDTVIELTWGRSLISFSPKVQTKQIVEKVIVSGWDAKKTGDERDLKPEASRSDIDLSGFKDQKLLELIDSQVAGTTKEISNENFDSESLAEQRAKDVLTDLYRNLITAGGNCVGDARIRTGTTLRISGLGVRYDGDYLVTKATHTISGSGYLVAFDCLMKGVVK